GPLPSFPTRRSSDLVGTTTYIDDSVNVPLHAYSYGAKLGITRGWVSPLSDTIQSIFLTGDTNSKLFNIDMSWTPYWGWSSPVYQDRKSTRLNSSHLG